MVHHHHHHNHHHIEVIVHLTENFTERQISSVFIRWYSKYVYQSKRRCDPRNKTIELLNYLSLSFILQHAQCSDINKSNHVWRLNEWSRVCQSNFYLISFIHFWIWESEVCSHTSAVMQLNYGFKFSIQFILCALCTFVCTQYTCCRICSMLNNNHTHFTPMLCAMCDPNIKIGVVLVSIRLYLSDLCIRIPTITMKQKRNIIFHFEHDGKII